MRLGVRVGQGLRRCDWIQDAEPVLSRLQLDEIWGFIGKKDRHARPQDSPEMGDVWTFCAIDSETKVVPSFKVGKRTKP